MQTAVRSAVTRGRLALRTMLAVIATALFVFLAAGSALAVPAPPTAPPPTATPQPASRPAEQPQPAPDSVNSLIDPALLESLQQSVVGLVTIWEEPVDPFAMVTEIEDPGKPTLPVMSICTGWFDSPTTIVTAGHCVDPAEGRLAMHMAEGPFDPETGMLRPIDPNLPEPKRTVWAFQPREVAGAVLTSPVIVRVDDGFRTADEGDTAKLEVYGMPPGKPLAIAAGEPQTGQTVTSIGFPGLNIGATDGVDFAALLRGGKSPAEVLQDSRLQPVSTSGTITSMQFREGVRVWQINADLAEGISGGPTVNAAGEVLGINSQMLIPFFGQNFNVITDTEMLRDFLGRTEPSQAAPTPAAPAQAMSTTGEQPQPAATPQPDRATGWGLDSTSAIGGMLVGALAIGGVARIRRNSAARRGDTTDSHQGSGAVQP